MREISDHMLDFVKRGMNLNGLPREGANKSLI